MNYFQEAVMKLWKVMDILHGVQREIRQYRNSVSVYCLHVLFQLNMSRRQQDRGNLHRDHLSSIGQQTPSERFLWRKWSKMLVTMRLVKGLLVCPDCNSFQGFYHRRKLTGCLASCSLNCHGHKRPIIGWWVMHMRNPGSLVGMESSRIHIHVPLCNPMLSGIQFSPRYVWPLSRRAVTSLTHCCVTCTGTVKTALVGTVTTSRH